MKQVQLSAKTGLSLSLLSQYLSGKFEAKNDNTYILAKALNCTPEYLLGWEDKEDTVSPYGDPEANLAYFANKPDLLELYMQIHQSDNLKLLFDKTRDLEPKDLEKILNIIKVLEENDG